MATAAARPRGSRSARSGRHKSSGPTRAALRQRLEARREEIEAAALTRVRAISDPAEVSDPAYAEGLRAAVCAAVDYGIQTTGREGPDPPIPVPLLAQARMAARVGIPLDTVLRRYFAGYSLLGYFILEEASHAGLTDGDELKRLLGAHAGLFDRLLAAVGEEHGRESQALALATGADRRSAERIERLLAGELLDTAEIRYELGGWHLALAAEGQGAQRGVRELAARLDCQLLSLPREDGVLWAWLGARRRLEPAVARASCSLLSAECLVGFGEPGESFAGWRRTHRQALAALGVARQGPERLVRYAEAALLASALQDDLLADSLRHLYLDPLHAGRDDGRSLRHTLRTYLAHDRNSASTAAALGVSRQTINSRLRLAEERIGRPLGACAGELEVALRLDPDRPAFPGKARPTAA